MVDDITAPKLAEGAGAGNDGRDKACIGGTGLKDGAGGLQNDHRKSKMPPASKVLGLHDRVG